MSYATSAAALPNSPTPVKINRYFSTSIVVSSPLRASIPRAPVFAELRDQLHRTESTANEPANDFRHRLAPIGPCRAPAPSERHLADSPWLAASTASPTATSPTEPPKPEPKPRAWPPSKPTYREMRP